MTRKKVKEAKFFFLKNTLRERITNFRSNLEERVVQAKGADINFSSYIIDLDFPQLQNQLEAILPPILF